MCPGPVPRLLSFPTPSPIPEADRPNPRTLLVQCGLRCSVESHNDVSDRVAHKYVNETEKDLCKILSHECRPSTSDVKINSSHTHESRSGKGVSVISVSMGLSD